MPRTSATEMSLSAAAPVAAMASAIMWLRPSAASAPAACASEMRQSSPLSASDQVGDLVEAGVRRRMVGEERAVGLISATCCPRRSHRRPRWELAVADLEVM